MAERDERPERAYEFDENRRGNREFMGPHGPGTDVPREGTAYGRNRPENFFGPGRESGSLFGTGLRGFGTTWGGVNSGIAGVSLTGGLGTYAGRGRHAGRGPRGYQRGDERIREEVCERLADHPDIDASEMEVAVENGEVTLSGTVEDRWMKRMAEDTADSVSGVRDVHNHLRVQQTSGTRL